VTCCTSNKRLLTQAQTANVLSLPVNGERSSPDSDTKTTKETAAFWDYTV